MLRGQMMGQNQVRYSSTIDEIIPYMPIGGAFAIAVDLRIPSLGFSSLNAKPG
ncbi:hypothetical protein [Sinorhizobium meliloti]|uniref:hypothetical protein n=1 Tax=Rhizobium meliloti TaxID=382 RepID=UPI001F2975EF|nr:hypothetical protein [Sinorhizobium meliloti]